MSELKEFAENVSMIDGPPVRMLGVSLPTRMIIVKLSDGSLWVNSPVSVPIQVLDRIKASGPIRYLVAPTKMHIWRLEEWHALFPKAELWIPRHNRNESRRLPFACILGGLVSPGWADDLDQLVFEGNLFIQEVFFLHKRSRTLIVADFIQITRLRRVGRCLTLFGKSAGLPIRTVAFRSTSGCLSRIGPLRGDRSRSCFCGSSTS
jgi:Domain of unknown function (DUF4336)